jgi:hypothetical protein
MSTLDLLRLALVALVVVIILIAVGTIPNPF